MESTTRRWLAGSVLALVVMGGAAALTLYAQPPAPTPSATIAPSSPTGGPALPTLPNAGSPEQLASRDHVTVNKQGDLLRFSRHVPGDAKPIVIDADEIFTWDEDGKVVMLLSGQVLVQQSVTQTRFDLGVAWIDLKRYRSTGILHLDLYAEGTVRLDVTLEGQQAKRAVLDLETRGEFRLRAHKGKVNRQNRASDPLVSRARDLGVGPRLIQTSAPPAQAPSSNVQPATTLPSAPKLPAFVPAPKPGPPATMGNPRSTSSNTQPGRNGGPAPVELLLVQATEPVAPDATGSRPLPPSSSGSLGDSVRPPALGANGLPIPAKPLPPLTPPPPPPTPTPGDNSNNPEPRRSSRQPADVPPPPDPPPSSDPDQGGPTVPLLPPPSQPAGPPTPPALPPTSPPRQYRIIARSNEGGFNLKENTEYDNGKPTGRKVFTATGGLILNVKNVPRIGNLDVEADRAVVWTRGGDPNSGVKDLQSQKGVSSNELEFYLAGHVTLRVQGVNGKEKSVLEADEVYYDTNRNVAVALNARLQVQTNRAATLTEPLVMVTRELLQTDENTFEFVDAEVFSSKLLSDPGLKIVVTEGSLENRTRPRTDLFGNPAFDRKTGMPLEVQESILEAKNVIAKLEGVPFFYTPYLITDARDPLGPLEAVHVGANRIFGFQMGIGLNVYKLFGVEPIDGTRWRVYLDYLSRRGFASGTTFSYLGKLYPDADPYDLDAKPGTYLGEVKLYGLRDDGRDVLGAQPPQLFTFEPPGYRGRATWRQRINDLPGGFDVVNQIALLSDRNFLEEYFKREFDQDPNQANFVYVKQQQDNLAWSALAQVRTSNWITTTDWLPRLDGYLIGQDLFNLFTSDTQISAGYAQLRPSEDPVLFVQGVPPPPIPNTALFPTTRRVDTARFAIIEELALPLKGVGPFEVVPYVKGALIEYSNDLNGDETGRAWGGGGVRASIPFSRLYPEACSELFNVKGINHKIVLSGNYFIARANERFTNFPQLDRLHDDASEQAIRSIKPYEPVINSYAGLALATSPLYDPQRYAIRRLIDNRFDTLDDIQVVQLDVRQRLQTKRGFPGAEHIIDWMVLDTSVSYFPEANQDNFGKPFSFFEYAYLWNVGDQTAIESTGWYDPQIKGPRIYTVGMFFTRPDRTNFYLGYRQTDPLQSRLVTASASYVFSPKYSGTFTVSYDFGVSESVTNSVLFTRTGTDLQVSLGFTYNTLQNNIGAIVEVVPTLLPLRRTPLTVQQGGAGGPFGR